MPRTFRKVHVCHRYLLPSGSARNIRTVMQAERVSESPLFITKEEYLDGLVFAMMCANPVHI